MTEHRPPPLTLTLDDYARIPADLRDAVHQWVDRHLAAAGAVHTDCFGFRFDPETGNVELGIYRRTPSGDIATVNGIDGPHPARAKVTTPLLDPWPLDQDTNR